MFDRVVTNCILVGTCCGVHDWASVIVCCIGKQCWVV